MADIRVRKLSCHEGPEEETFRVSVSLEQFFSDERARCFVSVGALRRVRWLRRRLRRLFALPGSLALISQGHLLPPDEKISPLLRPDDHVQVVRASVELDDRADSPGVAIEPTDMDSAQDERHPPKRKRIDFIHQESPPSDLVNNATNIHRERPQSYLADKGSDVCRERPRSLSDIGSNLHQERPRNDQFEVTSNRHRESPGSDQVDISWNNFNITDRTADAAITSTEDVVSVIESISAREDYLNEMKERTLRMLDEIAPAQRRRRTRRRRRPKPVGAPEPTLAEAPQPALAVAPEPALAEAPEPTLAEAPKSIPAVAPAAASTAEGAGAAGGAWTAWTGRERAGVLRNASAAPREPRVVRPLLAP